jgi:hypothetical protein
VTDGAPAPLVGRTTLGPEDGSVLFKATQARIGYFNQPRMLSFAALVAMVAAILCMEGYGRTPKALLGVAVVLYAAAVAAGLRTTKIFGERFGDGHEREIVVSEDGVEVREAGMSVVQAWSRFDRAYETRDHLVLLAGPGVVAIPKRAFAPDDLVRVRERVRAKVRLDAIS